VAGAIIDNHFIRVPGATDDTILVVREPIDQEIGFRTQTGRYFGLLQTFDRFKRNPGVGKLFHFSLFSCATFLSF